MLTIRGPADLDRGNQELVPQTYFDEDSFRDVSSPRDRSMVLLVRPGTDMSLGF